MNRSLSGAGEGLLPAQELSMSPSSANAAASSRLSTDIAKLARTPVSSRCRRAAALLVAGGALVPVLAGTSTAGAFPARSFDITRFAAVGDGVTDCTEAFRAAIAACHRAGGGRVLVPSGEFLTGAIHLRSNVNLHVSGTIRFHTDPARYLPVVMTRWEVSDRHDLPR